MKRFSILDYGAQSGTDELQTEAIQTCIDACFLAGGGVVEIPQGDYRTGGLRLRSGVTLHLLENAHLLGSRNPEDYGAFLTDTLEPVADDDRTDAAWSPATERIDKRFFVKCASRWNNALIRAIDARNLAIIGEPGAYFDGCDCFDEQGEEHYRARTVSISTAARTSFSEITRFATPPTGRTRCLTVGTSSCRTCTLWPDMTAFTSPAATM